MRNYFQLHLTRRAVAVYHASGRALLALVVACLSGVIGMLFGIPAPLVANRLAVPVVAASNPDPSFNGRQATDSVRAAIRQAVLDVDAAQAKAVSTRDLSGLGAGATTEFAAQQMAATQDLLDRGVIDIDLVDVDWGPITVNEATATVVAFETWVTTNENGTADQSRIRDFYTIADQHGVWQVQADEQRDTVCGEPPEAPAGQQWRLWWISFDSADSHNTCHPMTRHPVDRVYV